MPNIFKYQDYRRFLQDYYDEKKAAVPSFSFQNFSNKAGFSSKSFLFNVMKGIKTISRASIVKLSIALNLSKTESEYFENLVYFNQAKVFTERDFYFAKLNSIHPVTTSSSDARHLRLDQFEFYSQWYHLVVRSLLDMYPDSQDCVSIAKKILPVVTPKQVQKSIDLLQKLGLIEKQKSGIFTLCSKSLSTGLELQRLAVQKLHLKNMELAADALKKFPSDKRNFSSMTLGISQNAYNKICSEVTVFQQRIAKIVEVDENSDNVYQLNLQLFPVSKITKKAIRPHSKSKHSVK